MCHTDRGWLGPMGLLTTIGDVLDGIPTMKVLILHTTQNGKSSCALHEIRSHLKLYVKWEIILYTTQNGKSKEGRD